MTEESKLIPILREGVDIIKMVLFKELKSFLKKTYPPWSSSEINLLAGAILNSLFGTLHGEDPFQAYSEKQQATIERELGNLANHFPQLRIPVTDALRIQFLCDSLEGINNEEALVRAEKRGLLLRDREIPLPNTFISLAKTLGVTYSILSPSSIENRIQ
ncbi:MAG: hypothetical protein FP816_14285 [Desulfobacteraceae bacterium]|nr:hypothetical protein [Desulfobacteraceae bacterium]MBU4000936.1 hypothetical protein [Pseudomonadota bacterium]MBU4053833.1 hypothetical protein [Pseudomonadota bacterium]